MSINLINLLDSDALCVTAAGFDAVLPVTTLGSYVVVHLYGQGAGRNDDSVWDGFRILTSRMGGHALASPKGGGPCSLTEKRMVLHSCYGPFIVTVMSCGLVHVGCDIIPLPVMWRGRGHMAVGYKRREFPRKCQLLPDGWQVSISLSVCNSVTVLKPSRQLPRPSSTVT